MQRSKPSPPRSNRSSQANVEHQLTHSPYNHILTNAAVWSPDGKWIVYDIRSDRDGSLFDGDRIEQVNIETGEVQILYQSKNAAKCGVATYSPTEAKVIFILGPENPTNDWQYGPTRRRGVIIDTTRPGAITNLDARNLIAPYTPGALRGGSHLHTFGPDGWVSFTYNDNLVHSDQRNVGIAIPGHQVRVPQEHPCNHDGAYFSVLATRTVASPKPGSNEIRRAFEDAWLGTNGYLKPDGSRQKHAIAFQGEVITETGQAISEVFIVDLPNDPTQSGNQPLEGSATTLPAPPRRTYQRRLTFTAAGISGPRHWLRSSPDGSRIAFLMQDCKGIVQLWTISPNGGEPQQITQNPWPIESAFTWSPDGQSIAHIMDRSLFITNVTRGVSERITKKDTPNGILLPHACVFSPDSGKVGYLRTADQLNQIFIHNIE
jgi:Tol biopolymer transport system component